MRSTGCLARLRGPAACSSRPPCRSPTAAIAWVADALASVKVLLLADANPVFDAPKAWKVREALAAIPFIASFGSFLDDTSVLADLILPDHSFLESWVDAHRSRDRSRP